MLSEVYWVAFTSTIVGLVLGLARLCYKSKCQSIECLGCFKLERNTEGELKEDAIELRNKQQNEESKQESPGSEKTVVGSFSESNPMKQLRLFAP
jgi:hypothetical protein